MAFGFFKKKKEEEPHYDPTNITVKDVRRGFVLEYDMKTWEVAEEFEYDWGNENFSYEFKLVSADEAVFLSVEEDDEIECVVSRKLNFGKLDEDERIEDAIREKGRPPRRIEYQGVEYFREGESSGHFRNLMDESWESFVSWDFYDEEGKRTITIEHWGGDDYEASVGRVVSPESFTNILPAS